MLAGDWHCDVFAADAAIRSAWGTRAQLVVQLGDFGLWSGPSGERFLDEVSARAVRFGVPVAFLDGNHEDFDLLERYPVDAVTGLRTIREQLWHIPRGSRWSWAGLAFAALGGGTSLDRPGRIPGQTWWPQEAVTERQAQQVIADGPTDVLLLHDCPAGVPVPGITPESSRAYWPEEDLRIARAHAALLAGVATALQPAVIFHGHMHVRHSQTVTAFGCRTLVTGLGDGTDTAGNRLRAELGDLAARVARLRRGATD